MNAEQFAKLHQGKLARVGGYPPGRIVSDYGTDCLVAVQMPDGGGRCFGSINQIELLESEAPKPLAPEEIEILGHKATVHPPGTLFNAQRGFWQVEIPSAKGVAFGDSRATALVEAATHLSDFNASSHTMNPYLHKGMSVCQDCGCWPAHARARPCHLRGTRYYAQGVETNAGYHEGPSVTPKRPDLGVYDGPRTGMGGIGYSMGMRR